MVSASIQLLSHVVVRTNNRAVAAEGLEGARIMNTLCGSDAGARLTGNNDGENCISKFIFDSAALAVLKEEITKSNEAPYSDVT